MIGSMAAGATVGGGAGVSVGFAAPFWAMSPAETRHKDNAIKMVRRIMAQVYPGTTPRNQKDAGPVAGAGVNPGHSPEPSERLRVSAGAHGCPSKSVNPRISQVIG